MASLSKRKFDDQVRLGSVLALAVNEPKKLLEIADGEEPAPKELESGDTWWSADQD